MKILMFNYEYPPLGGGGGVVHSQLAEELAERHELIVVTSAYQGLPANDRRNGVGIRRVKVIGRNELTTASIVSMLSYYPASLRAGERIIRDFKPDLINSHFAVPTGATGARLARRHRVPHILNIYGGDLYDPSKRFSPHRVPGLRQTVRWVMRNTEEIIADSLDTATNARRYYGIEDSVQIVPLGLRKPDVVPVPRSTLGLAADQFILVAVGRLIPRKALDELIRIVARIRIPRVQLLIVGAGPVRKRLEALVSSLGVAERIVFAGHVDEQRKLELLLAADAFVSTSMHEGFGLAFLEAMFCGLPVVCYDRGGQTDFLVNERSGYLVSWRDEEAFEDALRRIAARPDERRKMGTFNRERAEAYTAAEYAKKFEASLVRCLSKAGRS